jgi:hypothetical protein
MEATSIDSTVQKGIGDARNARTSVAGAASSMAGAIR